MIWRILSILLVCPALEVRAQQPADLKPEVAVSASIGAEKVDRYSIAAGAGQIIHIISSRPAVIPGFRFLAPGEGASSTIRWAMECDL